MGWLREEGVHGRGLEDERSSAIAASRSRQGSNDRAKGGKENLLMISIPVSECSEEEREEKRGRRTSST